MKLLKLLRIALVPVCITLVFLGCQDMERPPFSDYPLDGPVVTINSPSPTGSTVIQTNTETGSIQLNFSVSDDIGIASIVVMIDGNEIANYTNFDDPTMVVIDGLVYDSLTNGDHTFTLTATDTDGNVETVTIPFIKMQSDPYAGLDGEVFYMPFEESYTDLVSFTDATVVGNPGFSEDGAVGYAYKGAEGSYLTFPAATLTNEEFSASFWFNLNAAPDRAGILVMGPEDTGNANYPDTQNDRSSGFRLFREAGGDGQIFKLNVGNGSGDNWFDGGAAASLPADAGWAHIAFTISNERVAVYINGNVVREGEFGGISWDGIDILSIMSGAPRFTEWGHLSDQSLMDELRIFDKALTADEVSDIMSMRNTTFSMSFDGNFNETVTGMAATVVGSPTFTDGQNGQAYQGAEGAYLTFEPTEAMLTEEFSATMWYNLNAVPDRAGILVLGPEDTGNANYPDVQNKRTSGFRFFREAGGDGQIFKLNVGNGSGDNWFDGGAAASLPADAGWAHIAFTISNSRVAVYINGEVVSSGDFGGISWEGANLLSIMSGGPRFSEWGHNSDLSLLDELKFYNVALTQEQIQDMLD